MISSIQISTLYKHKKLSTAGDSYNCHHRHAKYLIVGLSLCNSNHNYDGLGNRTAALILNTSAILK